MNVGGAAALGGRKVAVRHAVPGKPAQVLEGNFQVVSATPPTPSISYMSPLSGLRGQTFNITFSGRYTHWNPATTTLAIGDPGTSGITVNSFQVTSPTSAIANIAIAPNAPFAQLIVEIETGAELVQGAFSIVQAVPTLTLVDPGAGMQGATLSVNVLGQYTGFNDTTTFSFGAGIAVEGIEVLGPTIARVQIAIDQLAPQGAHAVIATTGGANVGGASFVVTASQATIIAVTPNTARQNDTVTIDIVGANTHWGPATAFSVGGGINLTGQTVSDATHASVTLEIQALAGLGARAVTATTGGEIATMNNAFIVQPGTPLLLSAGPGSGQQQQNITLTILGQSTNWVQGQTTVNSGPGVTITPVNVTGPTSITANAKVEWFAALGVRALTVTTGSQVLTLPNALNIDCWSGSGVATVAGAIGPERVVERRRHRHEHAFHAEHDDRELRSGHRDQQRSGDVADVGHSQHHRPVQRRTWPQNSGADDAERSRRHPERLHRPADLPGNSVRQPAVAPARLDVGRQGDRCRDKLRRDHRLQLRSRRHGEFEERDQRCRGEREHHRVAVGGDLDAQRDGDDGGHGHGNESVQRHAWSGLCQRSDPEQRASEPERAARYDFGKRHPLHRRSPGGESGGGCDGDQRAGHECDAARGHRQHLACRARAAERRLCDDAWRSGVLPGRVRGEGGPAVIVTVVPSSAEQNDTLDVAISALRTNFVQGQTNASFGAGVIVQSTTVTSATEATAHITVQPSAAVGTRTVVMTTGAEIASLANAFEVLPGEAEITAIAPSGGVPNSTVVVSITGALTHFVNGVTLAKFGPGISVNGAAANAFATISVSSPTTATATLNISASASPGPRTVTIQTGAESVTTVGFAVASTGYIVGGFNGARAGAYALVDGNALGNFRTDFAAKLPLAKLTATDTLNDAFLGGVDVALLSSVTGDGSAVAVLSSAEQLALRNFVRGGGGAVILVDNDAFAGSPNSSTVNNSFLSMFGVHVTGTDCSTGGTISAPQSSPVTNGPFGAVASVALTCAGWFDDLGPASALGTVQNGMPFLAVIPANALAPGSGAVVLLSDTALAAAYWTPAYRSLIFNAIAFVAPEPLADFEFAALNGWTLTGGAWTVGGTTNTSPNLLTVSGQLFARSGAPNGTAPARSQNRIPAPRCRRRMC